MAWPEYKEIKRRSAFEEGSTLRKYQDKQPNYISAAGNIMKNIDKAGTIIPRTIIGTGIDKFSDAREKNKKSLSLMKKGFSPNALSALNTGKQVNFPNKSLLPASNMTKLQLIPFTGDNKPNIVKDPVTNVPSNDNNTKLATLGNTSTETANGYEITDKTWTPKEEARFMQTPVHGGTRARSGPEFVARPASGWHPNYKNSWNTGMSDASSDMPNFTAPGFSGDAAKARINSQRQQWLQRQQANNTELKLATINQTGQLAKEQLQGDNKLSELALTGQNQLANTALSGQNQLINTRLAGQNTLANTTLSNKNKLSSIVAQGKNKYKFTRNQAAEQIQKLRGQYDTDNSAAAFVNGKRVSFKTWLTNKESKNFYDSLYQAFDPASAEFDKLTGK